jgi:hypothetical protein
MLCQSAKIEAGGHACTFYGHGTKDCEALVALQTLQ